MTQKENSRKEGLKKVYSQTAQKKNKWFFNVNVLRNREAIEVKQSQIFKHPRKEKKKTKENIKLKTNGMKNQKKSKIKRRKEWNNKAIMNKLKKKKNRKNMHQNRSKSNGVWRFLFRILIDDWRNIGRHFASDEASSSRCWISLKFVKNLRTIFIDCIQVGNDREFWSGATFFGVQNAFFWDTTFREGGAYFGIQKLFLGY